MTERIPRVAGVITDFWPHRMSHAAAAAIEALYAEETIDAQHLAHQREWSTATFGPGARLGGVLDHIRKELVEVEENPGDVTEWVDVIILAFDGALRSGHEPQQIIDAVKAKQARNEARTWPDWRGRSEDEAIEHIAEANEVAASVTATPNPQVAGHLGIVEGRLTLVRVYADDTLTAAVHDGERWGPEFDLAAESVSQPVAEVCS